HGPGQNSRRCQEAVVPSSHDPGKKTTSSGYARRRLERLTSIQRLSGNHRSLTRQDSNRSRNQTRLKNTPSNRTRSQHRNPTSHQPSNKDWSNNRSEEHTSELQSR